MAVKRIFRYHNGTIRFGLLIIAKIKNKSPPGTVTVTEQVISMT